MMPSKQTHSWQGGDTCLLCGLKRKGTNLPMPRYPGDRRQITKWWWFLEGRWIEGKTPTCPVPPEMLAQRVRHDRPKRRVKDPDAKDMIKESNRLLRIAGVEAVNTESWRKEWQKLGNYREARFAMETALDHEHRALYAVAGALHVMSMESY